MGQNLEYTVGKLKLVTSEAEGTSGEPTTSENDDENLLALIIPITVGVILLLAVVCNLLYLITPITVGGILLLAVVCNILHLIIPIIARPFYYQLWISVPPHPTPPLHDQPHPWNIYVYKSDLFMGRTAQSTFRYTTLIECIFCHKFFNFTDL